jgi:hypothetical protein
LDAETWVLILTLIGYLLSMIWVGYRVPNRIQGKDVYVLAGRNLPRVGTRLRGLNLTTVTDFARCSGVYKKFSAQDPPARKTIGAGLPGILVEASCVAGVRGSA